MKDCLDCGHCESCIERSKAAFEEGEAMEENDYRQERAARWRKIERAKIALAVYRDLCLLERKRLDEMMDVAVPVDYKLAATCAVEAADTLLEALEPQADEPIIPEYVG
jgi:hypothetical protein